MNVYIVLLIQMCIAGGTHIVAKAVVRDVDAVTLTFLRSLLSTAGLMTILLVRRTGFSIDRRDWPWMIWLGILGLPINQFFYLYGLRYSTAANGALLYATTPVVVLVLSYFMLKERVSAKKILGIALAFAGVAIIIFERGVKFSSDFTFGNLIIFVAVIAWGLFTIQGKKMVVKYGAVKTTTLALTIGTIVFLPFGILSAATFPFEQISTAHWMGVLYLGLGTSVFGYMLWYYALGRIEASKAAVFANGQPILATILALLFLNYAITVAFVIGGTITLAGVIITQRG